MVRAQAIWGQDACVGSLTALWNCMMSKPLKYADSAARPAPPPEGYPTPSNSLGVDVVLKGWKTGLNKVQLTKTLHAGGIGLSEASKLTGMVLDGQEVRVHLNQFPTFNRAYAALSEMGVAEVRE